MQNNDFSTPIIFNTYLRLGFISYCLKNYDASINWLLKAFNIRKSLTKDLLILCSSLEKLGKIDELKIILNETDIKSNKSNYSKMIYTYYKIKHQKENKSKQEIIELENYICDILKPYFNTYGQIHKNIFNDDLKEYVKITGNYKKYYDFNNS